jgi:hypothetical protein
MTLAKLYSIPVPVLAGAAAHYLTTLVLCVISGGRQQLMHASCQAECAALFKLKCYTLAVCMLQRLTLCLVLVTGRLPQHAAVQNLAASSSSTSFPALTAMIGCWVEGALPALCQESKGVVPCAPWPRTGQFRGVHPLRLVLCTTAGLDGATHHRG